MFALLIASAISANWAVLMAGSRGYNNYRHQADVFNIYNLLTKRGFDPEHIITLAYNDVVNHELNPFKGQVFSSADHKNVFPGNEKIDYQGKDATAENFIRVLTGNSKHGRSLQSTKEDNVFVYFNDHGAPGLLCVPSNNGPELYADQIEKTLQEMKAENRFGKLFFVIEACYSGSVAKNISIPDVFMFAAAGPTQSSYSADWDAEIDAFRTNEFTKNFVNYVKAHSTNKIIDCVNDVSKTTERSHVTAYGDFKVSRMKLSEFLLEGKEGEAAKTESKKSVEPESNGIPTKRAFIEFLERRIAKATGTQKTKLERMLEQEKQRRLKASSTFKHIARKFDSNGESMDANEPLSNTVNYNCYRTCVEGYRLFCGEVDEYELPKLRVFANLCENINASEILTQIREVCPQRWWRDEDLYI